MNRGRRYHIVMRKSKIKRRREKILQAMSYRRLITDKEKQIIFKNKSGYLNKCYYNLIGNGIKTKAKNMYTGKHHKGVHGKAVRYSRHDKSQIIHMKKAIDDYMNE